MKRSSASREQLGFSELTDAIEKGYTGLDDARSVAIGGLLQLRQARTRTLQRRVEAATKSGDKAAFEDASIMLETNQKVVTELQREAAYARTELPDRKKGAAVIHGRVYYEGQPGPGLKADVAVFEFSGNEIGKRLAKAVTDARGYFKMSVTIPAAGRAASAGTQTGIVAALDQYGREPIAARTVPLAVNSLSYRELVVPAGKEGDSRKAQKRKK